MSAGDLTQRIAFESIAPASSAYGIVAGAWTEQFTTRAAKKVLVGSEPIIAQRLQGVQPVVWKVRSSEGTRAVTTAYRIRDVRSGVYYNIRAVTPDANGRWIEFLCATGVAT